MSAVTRLFQRDQVEVRSSARIREEIAALPQPQRYSQMLHEVGQRRAELANLSGQELKDGERAVAALDADAAAYRAKHSRVFDQAEALIAELVEVQQRERQAMIADRMDFHTVEAADLNRQIREADSAGKELLAQRIATHMLAKAWGIDIPWTLGFPPMLAEKRAREILAELQA